MYSVYPFIMLRYTITTTCIDGTVNTNECEYRYETADAIARIKASNDYWHDVTSIRVHDNVECRDIFVETF